MEILSWFLLEALAAAGLLALVVWWTWSRAPENESETERENSSEKRDPKNAPKE